MGWRNISAVQPGDLVSLEGRLGTVAAKTRWPETARTVDQVKAFTLVVEYGDTSRPYIIDRRQRVFVITHPKQAAT